MNNESKNLQKLKKQKLQTSQLIICRIKLKY